MPPLVTMQNLIDQQPLDAAAVSADETQLSTDEAMQTADANSLTASLATTGPLISISGNTGTIVAPPGVTVQAGVAYPLASSVPIPAAAPAPALRPAPDTGGTVGGCDGGAAPE